MFLTLNQASARVVLFVVGRILADIASGLLSHLQFWVWTCTLPNLSTANRSYKISTRKNFEIVTKQRKPGELTVPEQEEEPGTFITITRNNWKPCYYNTESSRHQLLLKLAIFIVATNVPSPSLIVKNSVEIDRKYQVPNRKGVFSSDQMEYVVYRKEFDSLAKS